MKNKHTVIFFNQFDQLPVNGNWYGRATLASSDPTNFSSTFGIYVGSSVNYYASGNGLIVDVFLEALES
jgi:hypothetical protein